MYEKKGTNYMFGTRQATFLWKEADDDVFWWQHVSERKRERVTSHFLEPRSPSFSLYILFDHYRNSSSVLSV